MFTTTNLSQMSLLNEMIILSWVAIHHTIGMWPCQTIATVKLSQQSRFRRNLLLMTNIHYWYSKWFSIFLFFEHHNMSIRRCVTSVHMVIAWNSKSKNKIRGFCSFLVYCISIYRYLLVDIMLF